MQAPSLAQADTTYSADSIEWCPFEGFQDLFVCGTYQVLEPDPDSTPSHVEDELSKDGGTSDDDIEVEQEVKTNETNRTGRLLLYRFDAATKQLEERQTIETDAILDAKWSPFLEAEGCPRLTVGDAKGKLTTYKLDIHKRHLLLETSLPVGSETTLCLSLDFSHRLDTSTRPSLIASLSDGSLIHAIPVEGQRGYAVEAQWHAHDFEPWCAAWDNWDLNTAWSGGDDLKLKRWDVRAPGTATFVNKQFEAGVTTITSSPHTPNLLVVGSYDSNLRVYDFRHPREALDTITLDGGIWRARFHPSPTRAGDVLLACMHGGFRVVRLGDAAMSLNSSISDDKRGGDTSTVVQQFDGHASLAYGADWSRLPGKEVAQSIVATCSFYDHALHVWTA